MEARQRGASDEQTISAVDHGRHYSLPFHRRLRKIP
jgi:hypothetical protein